MNTNRLSLSSTMFDGRVKQNDTRRVNNSTSLRIAFPKKDNGISAQLHTKSQKMQGARNLPVDIQGIRRPSISLPVSDVVSVSMAKQSIDNQKSVTVSKAHTIPNQTKPFPESNNWQHSAIQKSQESIHKLALQAVGSSQASNSTMSNQFYDFNPAGFARKASSKLTKAFYMVGVLVFIFASSVSVQTLLTNRNNQIQAGVLGARADEQGVAEGTGSDPSEAEVSSEALANYQVDPEMPRYLRIPELGVFSRIKPLGTDKNGAVDAPWNVHDAGWYNGSAKPGNAMGSSLILGHVSSWTTSGVFKKLGDLSAGARFEIEKGSGEKIIYEVTRSEDIPLEQVNMARILGTEVAGEHDLKLMTCSGSYNRETESYAERKVVYAKQIK